MDLSGRVSDWFKSEFRRKTSSGLSWSSFFRQLFGSKTNLLYVSTRYLGSLIKSKLEQEERRHFTAFLFALPVCFAGSPPKNIAASTVPSYSLRTLLESSHYPEILTEWL
jgi:hypothetical protein